MWTGISSGLKQVRDYGVKLRRLSESANFEYIYTQEMLFLIRRIVALCSNSSYDKAIETIQAVSGYESNEEYTKALEEYDLEKSRLFQWNDNYTITHIFFHTLIVKILKRHLMFHLAARRR